MSASRPHILVAQPVHADVLERLQNVGTVHMNPGPSPWSEAELKTHLHQADALMAFMTERVDAELLCHAPRLRVLACALKGYDNFDVAACARAGVQLSFVPDLLTEPTAELALGLAIAAGRHLLAGDATVRGGDFAGWRPQLYGVGLHGATVAVVGLGRVGRAIVDRLQGFGCARVLGVDPQVSDPRTEPATLEQALRESDYVFLAVPLLPHTLHLVDAAALAHAKPGQLLVNVGRGSVADEAAVAAALQADRLGAYAADVFACEDWGLHDRPRRISEDLLLHPRTVFTPHLGSAVARVRRAIEHRAADNLLAALTGQSLPDPVPLN